eukprot:TRINITY_DN2898_c0_g1_i2.p1 TRINITY_DN2898_c0_g1~~TRINITY_DN2898_c0_g1_i2.p1  ORF type:complete len:922 (+),score=339.06 TRINITY_DN2898_c0_g1_i2:250-3015(+)
MASWFRSEDMTYVSLIMNEDAAHSCISDLGKLGVVQFTDLNPELTPFQRRYVNFIKRIDELERKIKFFGEEIHKFGLHAAYQGEVGPFIDSGGVVPGAPAAADGAQPGSPPAPRSGVQLLETMERDMEKEEQSLVELNRYSERLTAEYNEKVEFQEVLLKTRGFFVSQVQVSRLHEEERVAGAYQAGDVEGGAKGSLASLRADARGPQLDSPREPHPLLGAGMREGAPEIKFSYIAGVVNLDDRSRFERQLFRSTRGNCYVRFSEIEQPLVDPSTGEAVPKLVFLVFFKSAAIEAKIKKICDAFGAKRYPVPDMDDYNAVRQLMDENYSDLHDARLVLLKNRDARIELCTSLAARLEIWNWVVLREKAAYHALNAFKPDVRGMLRGEGWVLSEALPLAQAAVRRVHANMGQGVPSYVEVMPQPWPTPPTFFKLNAFTVAYQEFVDTYGVPRYKEANPALFAAATFPFLYGVMYGDIGHGFCLFLGGLFLIYSDSKRPKGRRAGKDDEMAGGMYLARYMITMMGFFSVYAGLVYNDWFSIALDIFGTKYEWSEHAAKGDAATLKEGSYGDPSQVYAFGMDPSWHVAENELLFYNSMKMKMSVILGILQMTMGIILKAMNAKYFKQPLDFYLEFVPMIIFDCALFGYMVLLIFMKWGINWQERMYMATCLDTGFTPQGDACVLGVSTTAEMCPLNYGGTGDGCQPPNLITTLINIALAPGTVDDPMYKGQGGVQTFLLLVAFFCIPVLLFGKPYMLKKMETQRHTRQDSFASDSELVPGAGAHANNAGDAHAAGGHDDSHSFGEVIIHQAIETIEFVLGMVSNTASYLRLWALSLAHTELATVFWEKAMLTTIEMNNPIAVFCGFAVFMSVTFGVLLCMDVLECFLHALRLHWVEFQNKFYKADGYKFQPFSFHTVLENAPIY